MSVSTDIDTTFGHSSPWPQCLEPEGRRGVHDQPAVYVLWTATAFPRLVGSTNVLYVGSTLRLGGATDGSRLYSYRYATHLHSKTMRERAAQLMAAGFTITLRWWLVPDEVTARAEEKRLLRQHLSEHLEYAPFNRKRV
jgi:hypothetical protein